jgi:hypothetical protein
MVITLVYKVTLPTPDPFVPTLWVLLAARKLILPLFALKTACASARKLPNSIKKIVNKTTVLGANSLDFMVLDYKTDGLNRQSYNINANETYHIVENRKYLLKNMINP